MIVVGATTCPYKALAGESAIWLAHAPLMRELTREAGHEIDYFVALEVDARKLEPFGPLVEKIADLEGGLWQFSLDDGDPRIDATNRLTRICMGRNLVIDYALREKDVTHILFLDTDIEAPADTIVKLLELDCPVAGGDISSYCLGGRSMPEYPFPVQRHWNSAGCLLVRREVFRKVRWRTDLEAGMSDDPCYDWDAQIHGFGFTLVRHDIPLRHVPLIHFNQRGHDTLIIR